MIEHRMHEHPAYYGEMVWILMMLEQWLQGHAPNVRLSEGRALTVLQRSQRQLSTA
jgi:hypothetical protein